MGWSDRYSQTDFSGFGSRLLLHQPADCNNGAVFDAW